MNEEERVKYINNSALDNVKAIFDHLENGSMTEEDFLGQLYGSMFVGAMLGYNIEEMTKNAVERADKLANEVNNE